MITSITILWLFVIILLCNYNHWCIYIILICEFFFFFFYTEKATRDCFHAKFRNLLLWWLWGWLRDIWLLLCVQCLSWSLINLILIYFSLFNHSWTSFIAKSTPRSLWRRISSCHYIQFTMLRQKLWFTLRHNLLLIITLFLFNAKHSRCSTSHPTLHTIIQYSILPRLSCIFACHLQFPSFRLWRCRRHTNIRRLITIIIIIVENDVLVHNCGRMDCTILFNLIFDHLVFIFFFNALHCMFCRSF